MVFCFTLYSFAKLFAFFNYQAYTLSAVGEMLISIVLLKHGKF